MIRRPGPKQRHPRTDPQPGRARRAGGQLRRALSSRPRRAGAHGLDLPSRGCASRPLAKENKKLKDEKLKEALEGRLDTSVKELVSTPTVLATMGDKFDWTQKLGDAVLAQQADVMDAIQRLRAKAQANGKLETTKQQTVTVAAVEQEADQQGANQQEADQQVADQQVIEMTSPKVAYTCPIMIRPWFTASGLILSIPPCCSPPPSGYIVGGAIATGLASDVRRRP